MPRVTTGAVAAKVIYLQTLRNGASPVLINQPVDILLLPSYL
jgi:hypothetical protein